MSKEVYFEAIFNQLPRLLGLLDRNVGSPAYGCFDRQYWHYRVLDFPCARFQEAALTLALIYNLDHEKNIYFKNKNILAWINAALGFWCKIQDRNGSFSEWYPQENSFVATAFSAYAISETLLVLDKGLINEYEKILACLKKSGDWLIPRIEKRAVNQTAGAAIALYNIYLLSGENRYLIASRKKIDFLGRDQDKEGWFLEYGGADIGYLSLAIGYLAKYYKKTKDKYTFKILEKAVLFLFNFIHPDLVFGGSYASRNTEYIIPCGFEIMSGYLEKSNILARAIQHSIQNSRGVYLDCFDDRYLSYLGYDYLQAFMEAGDCDEDYKFKSTDSVINFSHLGIDVINQGNYQLVYNYKKGGVFKFTFSNNKTIEDWGVILESHHGKRYFSGWLNLSSISVKNEKLSFMVKTEFQEIRKILMSPLRLIFLRLFQLFFGSWPGSGAGLKNKLRDILITRRTKSPLILKRHFKLGDNSILITDIIEGARDVKAVFLGAKVSYIYVPSSCYFQIQDLDNQVLVYNQTECEDVIALVREYDFEGKLVRINF